MTVAAKPKSKSWAKLAQSPGKADSRTLSDAARALQAERQALEDEKGKIQTNLVNQYLARAAGMDVAGIDEAESRIIEINGTLRAMDKAVELLEKAHKGAKLRETKARLDALDPEIEKAYAEMKADHSRGLKALGEAFARLSSSINGNPFDVVSMLQHLIGLATAPGSTFALDYRRTLPDKMPSARNDWEELRQERADLLKQLK